MKILLPITEQEFLPHDGSQKYLAVKHPGFFNKNSASFPYETNTYSTAYIHELKGKEYFQGALEGGSTKHFMDACRYMANNIDIDMKNNIIAIWHDESHWNRFLIESDSVKILGPEYAYPEDWKLPFDAKILMLDKSKVFPMASIRGFSLKNIKDSVFRFLKKLGLI